MSVDDWLKAFDFDRVFFDELVNTGALQRKNGAGIDKIYRLNFVGLMSTKSFVYFSFPKIYDGTENYDEIGTIIRCLRRYEHSYLRKTGLFDFGGFDYLLDNGSVIDGFLELIDWTNRRGFHHDELETDDSLQSNINWQRTINQSLAIHTDRSVLYPYPVSAKYSNVLSALGILQATALLQYRDVLRAIVDPIAPALEGLWAECNEIVYHNSEVQTDVSSCIQILNDYEYTSQRDEDRALIRLLRSWIQSDWFHSTRPLMYGLNSFHTVWEHMCVQACSSAYTGVQHAMIASQPYCSLDSTAIPLAPQRPDILLSSEQGIIIADAKWYRMDRGDIPGTPDAIKQIAYQITINPSIKVVGNVLLLPSRTGQPWRRPGQISLHYDNKSDARFPPIDIVGLDWDLVASSYLKATSLPAEFFAWLAKTD